MRKLFLGMIVGLLVAGAAFANDDAPKERTLKGWVSDEVHGRLAAQPGKEEETKKCLASGYRVVFVTDNKKEVLNVENPDTLAEYAGQQVIVQATVNKASNSMRVNSVSSQQAKK